MPKLQFLPDFPTLKNFSKRFLQLIFYRNFYCFLKFLIEFINDINAHGFIAKKNNSIVGFAYAYTLLRPDGKTMFYLHSIGMLPNYQNNGYGTELMQFIKDYSIKLGCSEMFVITDKGNPRACHLYEKLGGKNDYEDEVVYVYDYVKGDK